MKKEYKQPSMCEVKLKHRSSLLQGSGTKDYNGTVGYNPAAEMNRKEA